MSILGIGDLASSFTARRTSAHLKSEFLGLTQELASGRKSDPFAASSGHTGTLTSVSHSLTLIGAYENASAKVSQKLNHAEIALGAIAGDVAGLGASLLASADAGDIANDALQSGAANSFQATLSALAVRVGPSYVFSGTASDTPPLADASSILADLETATAGAVTAADFYQRVDDWFSLPGGFDVSGYLGGATSAAGVRVSATDEITFELTAESSEIRDVLRDLAVIAMVEDKQFLGTSDEKVELVKSVASGLMSGEAQLTKARAAIGEQQQKVANASTQNSFFDSSLSEMKGAILNVDLFETAARFEEIQLQLESHYLVTSKTSRLSLTEFLR